MHAGTLKRLVLIPLALGAVVTAQRALAARPPAPPANPAIAFVRPSSAKLMKMNADGSSQATVTSWASSYAGPSWSPDASEIAFGSFDNSNAFYISVVRADGTNKRQIATCDLGGNPAWSPGPTPDGTVRIAFVDSDSDGSHNDVYLVRPDGSDRLSLTNPSDDYSENYPTWDPSGSRLAVIHGYVDVEAGRWVNDVLVLDLDIVGGHLAVVRSTNVTDLPGNPLHTAQGSLAGVAWAKTMDKLAVAADTSVDSTDNSDIWIIDLADLDNPVNLTAGDAADNRFPTWSSNDAEIAYQRRAGTTREIYSMNADGSNQHRLAKDGVRPDWKR